VHQRRIIRDSVAVRIASGGAFGGTAGNVALVEGNPAVGDSRVFRSREAPANVKTILQEGPMANIYARRDYIKPEDMPASGFDSGVKRTLELAVEITAAGQWAVDDKLDDLTGGVEDLLEGFNADPDNPDIPGLPSAEVRLTSTDIDSTDEYDVPLGGALMLYEVTYWRPYRTDTSPELTPCGGTIDVIINGGPAEALSGCDCP
jgi:hypothetical protein